MPKNLAVAVIHGMGTQDSFFAEDMIDELKDNVDDLGKDPDDIAWSPIFWSDILAQRQEDYLRDANANNDLDYIGLRRFIISSFGDASAYRKVDSAQDTVYELIHQKVRAGINFLDGEVNADAPLIVMAHSLGGHIMSNYIWDMQHATTAQLAGLSSFEQLHTLAGMVTFGCNIPLFTLAFTNIEPITFPAAQLPNPGPVRAKARWLNYFDADDVLGYPLKAINGAYDAVVDEDNPINVGGLFSSWNPLSHGKYWTDDDFTEPAADFIATFI